jgi:opacity protein-like surface antigen
MKSLLLSTALLLALPVSASAQDKAQDHWVCQDVGHPSQEPLGDREGHAIEVAQYSCRIESGQWAGAVSNGTIIWEWDGPKATMLSDSGVTRKPGGGTVVWKGDEGQITLTMTDGKVTGFTASGQGKNVLVIGDWPAKKGGPIYHWTAKPDGPSGQFTIDSTNEDTASAADSAPKQ